jgi:hypothetical protein
MNYYITRGGQQYGPYSLADLQKYVAAGNILPTDMARSDNMSQWLPVSQILSNIGAPQPPQPAAPQQPAYPQQPSAPQQPVYSQQPSAPQQPAYSPQPAAPQGYGQVPVYGQPQAVAPQQVAGGPLPPGQEWWVILLIGMVTCGIYAIIALFKQAKFVKMIRPASNALQLYTLAFFGYIGLIVLYGLGAGLRMGAILMFAPLIQLGAVIVFILAHFKMKAAIEEYYNTVEPINLRLSGVMVFFFNVYYFQYHFHRIYVWKTTGVWR